MGHKHLESYRKNFTELLRLNYTAEAVVVYLPYRAPVAPVDKEDATQKFRNYILRLKRLWNRNTGRPENEFRYLGVSEVSTKGQLHHHLIIPGNMETQEIIKRWDAGEAEVKPLYNDKGIPEIIQHITKSRLSFRKWTSAQSLELLPGIVEE